MVDIEKIQGQNILRLFRELQKDSTLLNVHLTDNNYKYLARIVDIRTRHNSTYFLIDYPESFKASFKNIKAASIVFEFTGKDEINYAFRSAAWQMVKNKLWLQLPRLVERKQRRRQFRIPAPAGTTLHFKLNSKHYELKVIDISLGGSLCVLIDTSNQNDRHADLTRTKYIEALDLKFRSENESSRVTIEGAEVKRLNHDPLSDRYEYALEFREIDSINKRKLNDQIYRFQREFLRNRLRVNA